MAGPICVRKGGKLNLTLKQLRYFTALAETLHFGKAAKLCHVSQPALSMQIKDLEGHLGVTLVERGSTKLLLTLEGREIAARARDILMAVQDLTELVSHRKHPLSGRLRLGVIPSIGPYLLPKLLPDLHDTYPELELSLRESQTELLVGDLLDGRLDLLILALPLEPEEIDTLPLFDDHFFVALPKVHTLASRDHVSQEELAKEHLLLLEEGHCLRDQALAVCQTANTDEFRASSLATVVQMVANGYGLTILPSLALSTEVGDPSPIAVIPFAEPVPFRSIGLAWRQATPHEDEFKELGHFIRQRFLGGSGQASD
jgi:LysR family hydrogen peroxide-inducible transcriptional activator